MTGASNRMLKRTFSFVSIAFIYFIITVLIHEAGHAFTGQVYGLGTPSIHVWPGIEVSLDISAWSFSSYWPEHALAYVTFIPETTSLVVEYPENPHDISVNPQLRIMLEHPNNNNYLPPIVGVMGSGITYAVSLLCTLFLWFCKPIGIVRTFSVFGAFLFYDILSYTIFPVFFGLQHLIFIGGNYAEPILFLAEMGIPSYVSISMVCVLCILQVIALGYISKDEGLI